MRALCDDEDFFVRLREAVEWAVDHSQGTDPRRSLRTHHLSPQLLTADRACEVRAVSCYRTTSLGKRPHRAVRDPTDLKDGRLVAFFPDAQLADGAAEAETQGYFDLHNTPPWDTWVGLFRADRHASGFEMYLVAYVPHRFVALAGGGGDICPDGSLMWLVETDVPLARELKARGWVHW